MEFDCELPRASLISITPDAEDLIARAYGICTGRGSATKERIPEYMALGHLTPIEHASATFHITCSRVVSHQLVRHRLTSVSQRSQRYTEEDKPLFVKPRFGLSPKADEAALACERAYTTAWHYYQEMLAMGVQRQLARYVLPSAMVTQLIVTANFREWRHIMQVRLTQSAQPEMRELIEKITVILCDAAPLIFGRVGDGDML